MTIPYTSYEASALQMAENMLAASATFQGIVPALKVANDIIIESVGGVNPLLASLDSATAISGNVITVPAAGTAPTTPFALVHEESFSFPEIALNTFGGTGVVVIQLFTLQTAADAPYEILRRVRNTAGGIRADIQALFGSTSPAAFMRGTVSLDSHQILDPSTELAGYCYSVLSIHWSAP